ncbi:hypothetical protein [Sandarakinorhabdus oryzae]|uniref:hypothetical protein n=1 Tax=Sandarakinorhabdus oryzae TaxID=2675220 RepID=UPI0012E32BAA|nr:hypothetical protein [Sandarakinorhabdus oryzae]
MTWLIIIGIILVVAALWYGATHQERPPPTRRAGQRGRAPLEPQDGLYDEPWPTPVSFATDSDTMPADEHGNDPTHGDSADDDFTRGGGDFGGGGASGSWDDGGGSDDNQS